MSPTPAASDGQVSGSALTRRLLGVSHGDAIFALVTAVGFGLVGVTFAIFVAGSRVINPFDTSWLSGDAAEAYLGWKFFRNEAHLSFPLGWSHSIGFPIGEPIAYLDCVPLVAVILWPVRHILPADFQYLGPYFALNCVLQLYFGYRICRRLSGNNKLAGIVGGLLFMTAPPFVWRAINHFVLTSHWLVLAALDIFLAPSLQAGKSRIVGSVALSFLAGGINPYLTFMVLLVLGAGNLRTVLSAKSFNLFPAFSFCVCVMAAVASLTIFGFIRPGESGTYPGEGYGHYSMNLLAPINPMGYGALLLKSLPHATTGQYEGYNYFGFGIILLGIVAFSWHPSAAIKLFTREAIAVWAIIGASLLLALSTKATAGSLTLYDIHIRWLQPVLSVFRSSGRLFWPAYYLILSGIIAAGCGVFEGRKLVLILSAAFLLQFADLHGLYRAIYVNWKNSSSNVFTDTGPWQTLGRDHRHLVVIPPWECNSAATPGGQNGFWIFGKLAAQQNMTTNSFYAGRISPTQREFFCNQQAVGLKKNGLDRKSAYVFASLADALSMDLSSHYCRAVDGTILCSIDDAKAGLKDSLFGEIPVTPTNTLIAVSSAHVQSNNIFGLGWSNPETWGRWTDGSEAEMILRVADTSKETVIDLSTIAFTPRGHQQRVEISANGLALGTWSFDSRKETELSLRIPTTSIRHDGTIVLIFRMPDAISPGAVGESGDSRMLGIGITAIRLVQR